MEDEPEESVVADPSPLSEVVAADPLSELLVVEGAAVVLGSLPLSSVVAEGELPSGMPS